MIAHVDDSWAMSYGWVKFGRITIIYQVKTFFLSKYQVRLKNEFLVLTMLVCE